MISASRRRARRIRSGHGFSIVEAAAAIAIMTGGIVALAQLLAIATTNNRLARNTSVTTLLAEQKMEELRAASWDTVSPSPGDSLDADRAGFVDYVDEHGAVLTSGGSPPSGTVYVRRWSIAPLPVDPGRTCVLQVLVTPSLVRRGGALAARMPGDARLVTLRTRRAGS
jgi:hypothetical protein